MSRSRTAARAIAAAWLAVASPPAGARTRDDSTVEMATVAAESLAGLGRNCLWHRLTKAWPGDYLRVQDVVVQLPMSPRSRQLYELLFVAIHLQKPMHLSPRQQAQAARRGFAVLTAAPGAEVWKRCDAMLAVSAPVVSGRFAVLLVERATPNAHSSTILPVVLEWQGSGWRRTHPIAAGGMIYMASGESRAPVQLDLD